MRGKGKENERAVAEVGCERRRETRERKHLDYGHPYVRPGKQVL